MGATLGQSRAGSRLIIERPSPIEGKRNEEGNSSAIW